MLTIQKLEKGYGIFDVDRLVDFAERQQDYSGLVDTVITVNAKLEIERIKSDIRILKERTKKDPNAARLLIMRDLKEKLHFLENYNV